MLFTPEASAYLFNTSAPPLNAQIFIRLQGRKSLYPADESAFGRASRAPFKENKSADGRLIPDFSLVGNQTGTLRASIGASPGGRMRSRVEIVSGFAHLRSI
ncbi:hypothetical protein HJB52_17040 [Rhizobium lentis]|uniref:hypothetical protein n=1 Tax=Rhizobium lentis TaxID=1138194 RepID=UPI001C82E32C|nr:hypothetical protein [Rhizobium lentis]MBX5103567.1 hypothetical protein [Rhizobium lentis]